LPLFGACRILANRWLTEQKPTRYDEVSNMFQTYQPSGKIGALAWPLMLVGMALAIALAFVYQFLLAWIPLIYVNFLLTWGMGEWLAFG
jgi:hypothetical protein